MWLSADEALQRLGVKPQTLYANVSRGRITAKPDPTDPRRSLYRSEDVDRLARRHSGRPPHDRVAAETIRWGDPVLDSSVTTIAEYRLLYRGQDAVLLAVDADLEAVAQLLWPLDGRLEVPPLPGPPPDGTPLGAAFAALAQRAARDAPSYGRSPKTLRIDAGSVLAAIATALCGAGEGPLHQRLAAHWGRPAAANDLRRALVLLADHELNASTFAARVAVSTGASLAAGALAGLATLSGPLHGSAATAVQSLAGRANAIGAEAAARECLAEGRLIPAFGHPLYPHSDVRAEALLAGFELPEPYATLAAAAGNLAGERPNIDFALAALGAAHHLPDQAPIQIFALARSVGWLAHMLEQVETGALIRPRARYKGHVPAK